MINIYKNPFNRKLNYAIVILVLSLYFLYYFSDIVYASLYNVTFESVVQLTVLVLNKICKLLLYCIENYTKDFFVTLINCFNLF